MHYTGLSILDKKKKKNRQTRLYLRVYIRYKGHLEDGDYVWRFLTVNRLKSRTLPFYDTTKQPSFRHFSITLGSCIIIMTVFFIN